MAQSGMKSFQFTIDGTAHEITLTGEPDRCRVQIGQREFEVQALPVSPHCLSLRIDGRTVTVYIAGQEAKSYLSVAGRQFVLEELRGLSSEPGRPQGRASAADNALASPMPGQVVKVLVCQGDVVDANQTVAIVEAMKMENELRASCRARVKKVSASAGDLVDAGQVIVELKAE
jgi:propionyl-CoA carboxylase alpha chain